MKGDILKARVNTFIGTLLLGSVALAAALIIWKVGHGENPLEKAFDKRYGMLTAELDK